MMPSFSKAFSPKDIFPNLFAGFISGLMTIIGSISYATLIFSGSLSPVLNLGIYSALVSATVIGFVVATRSSSPFTIAGPDANISAILALIVGAVALKLGESAAPGEVFSTVWAAIALSGFLGGIFLFLVGQFHLGRWIRFIPYPVVGGFLAGTGWLLARGSFKVMSDTALSYATLSALVQTAKLAHWLPGLGFAVLMLLVNRRYKHFLILPGMLIGAIIITHLLLFAAHIPVAEAGTQGWLLAALPGDLVLQSWKTLSLAGVQWSTLYGQAANLAALLVVAAIVILLNAASVEIETRTDVDLDSELKSTGIANFLAGPAGGMVGCMALSRSILNFKAGASSRISGMFAAILSGAVLLIAPAMLSYLPKPVLGGLLLYLGLGLVIEWIYDGWFKFARFDYFLVLGIVLIIAFWGFLPGVGIGLLVATILFAFNYSRINVIRHELSGSKYRSNVERSYRQQQILNKKGDSIFILSLQGYIFFGTAYPLLLHVNKRITSSSAPRVRFIILDFGFVNGIDSSSVLSFSKMRQVAEANDVKLIFAHLTPSVHALLAEGGCVERELTTDPAFQAGASCQLFSDLDYAIGWCEDRILEENPSADSAKQSFEEHLAELFPHRELIPDLKKYLEKVEAPPGYVMFKQGDPSLDLFFVESGEVTALLELPGGLRKRLRTMGPGTVVGEMGLYLHTPRSATIITEKPSVLYRLTEKSFLQMEKEAPRLASAMHEFMVRMLANRLAHANDELAHLIS